MENGIEHELQFGTARAEHRVKACVDSGEGRLRMLLDRPDRHEETAGQCNGESGYRGGKRMLPQAFQNNAPNGHTLSSAGELPLMRSNGSTRSDWDRTRRSCPV